MVVRNRHGIRVAFLITGQIGYFGFGALLNALVSGLVLTKMAATLADLIALQFMPQKKLYKKHKFEVTDDFSTLADQQIFSQIEKKPQKDVLFDDEREIAN
eukprot:TRINITY_DN3939_c0_g1_i1.p1 TRINITY_DN3939_c0_g1~~TRINITY_DN3939_c0_g1_i1.p1  ORF type:complete len:101 (-),score=11.64 TRINITY_DN3939_c0_g1_i1:26-328(-)